MKTIQTAVIGSGFIGPVHVEALRRIPFVEVIAICDVDEPKARNAAEKMNIPRAYGDWKKLLLDKDVQVIHNATPNFLHYEINMGIIKAGKHIISEKPLGMNPGESKKMVEAVQKAKLVNAINFIYRGYPLVQEAKNRIRKNDVGDILAIHGSYLQDWLLFDTDYNWRLEPKIGGALRAIGDIGSHWCDLIQYISGTEITAVCADLRIFHKQRFKPDASTETFQKGKSKGKPVAIKTEDYGAVLLRFKNGASGVFLVSQVSAGRKNRLWYEMDGTKSSLSWNQEEPNLLWLGRRETASGELPKDPGLLDEKAKDYAHYPGGHPEGYPDSLKNLFQNVYQDILKGTRGGDYPTFADGYRADRVNAAILKSNQIRKWVEVLEK